MGATKHLKMAMIDKGIKRQELAEGYLARPRVLKNGEIRERTAQPQTIYVMLSRDNMAFETVEEMADILGCEVVLRDKETGKTY